MAREKKEAKPKKAKKVLSYEQKQKKKLINMIIPTVIFGVMFMFFGITGIVTTVGSDALLKKVQAVEPVKYDHERFLPEIDENTGKAKLDENGCFNFVIDEEDFTRDFKILQLTDVHIGAGAFSIKKDGYAVQAVIDLVTRNQPDLVVVTGDIAYPVPFQSATLNNMKEAKVFATLMEKLGVYWTFTFGNHDTEAYSSYDRAQIADFYESNEWSKCIFTKGPSDVDGYGNFVINIKSKNTTTNVETIKHSLFMFDSHSYTDGDIFGAAWKYDYIHDNQVAWYENMVKTLGLEKKDGEILGTPSTAYFHIPLLEYRDAYNKYLEGNPEVERIDGSVSESGKFVYSSDHRSTLFAKMMELGSTTGTFCGHDHKNNISLKYTPAGADHSITLTYGMSIDYLAYPGIYKITDYRGGRIININPQDGTWTSTQDHYETNLAA